MEKYHNKKNGINILKKLKSEVNQFNGQKLYVLVERHAKAIF